MDSVKVKLLGKVVLEGVIHCETGMRIGGAREALEIGGIENIVIRDPVTEEPYIPGSSIKGKMRSLLEKAYGKEIKKEKDIHVCSEKDCEVCRVFGVPAGEDEEAKEAKEGMLTRLYVRDSRLTGATKEKLGKLELEVKYAEVKWENVINRITSKANPRQVERVPAGAEFEFEMVYNIYEKADVDFLKYAIQALRLVEDDYLGGYGSRGYGKVNFNNIRIKFNETDEVYKRGGGGKVILEGKRPEELLREFDKLSEELKRMIREEPQI